MIMTNEIDKINQMLNDNTPVFTSEDMGCLAYSISEDFDSYYNVNEAEVAISTYIDDYQIITNHVVEMVTMAIWKDLDGEVHDTEVSVFDEYYDSLYLEEKKSFDEKEMDSCEYYTLCNDEGAYKQYWYNVKTGKCYVRDRLLNHSRYGTIYNVEGSWTELKQISPLDATGEAYYMVDFGIHPLLVQKGYEGYCADEYHEYNHSNSIIENRIPFWHDLLQNPQLSLALRYGGLEMLDNMHSKNKEEYIAAVKIAGRHHYDPFSMRMWLDHIRIIIQLGKDLHNPHYVCPSNLAEEHRKYCAILEKKRRKEEAARRYQENLKRLKEEADREQSYQNKIAPYLSLQWDTDKYSIRVCPSVMDMIKEGAAMRHCVGSCSYDKKADSLILFCRSPKGERISTIEYSISKGVVLQNRGVCNQEPLFLKEVNSLLEADAKRIQNCRYPLLTRQAA